MLLHCHRQGQAPNNDNDEDGIGDDGVGDIGIGVGDGAHHEMGSEVGHAGGRPLLLLYHSLLHLRELSPCCDF